MVRTEAWRQFAEGELVAGVPPNDPLHLWVGWARGEAVSDAAQRFEKAARASGSSTETVESALAGAMSMLEEGDIEGAVRGARRATRMARSEADPELEFLALVVMARVRRWSGRPMLARIILRSLVDRAPSSFRRWMTWEWILCGASTALFTDAGTAPHAVRLHSVPAEPADPEWFAGWEMEWREHQPHRRDLRALRSLWEPLANLDEPFALGHTHDVPRGLFGPAGIDGALVLVRPDAAARRFARRVWPSAVLGRRGGDAVYDLREIDRPRNATLLTRLAFAGAQGIGTASLFEQVYGFPFVAGRHSNSLRVLLHRARKLVEPCASIERSQDQLVLRCRQAFVLPDPSTAVHEDSNLVEVLAAAGAGRSSTDIAEHLGVPRRTIQDSLRRLVDSGVCRTSRSGKRTLYFLEDSMLHTKTSATGHAG